MWNHAREWGYTKLPNPCTGIKGFALGKREVYITDDVFKAVWDIGSEPLRDALDLAYLTGQRPADTLKTSMHDIQNGFLLIDQGKIDKTERKMKLRIAIKGELAVVLARIKQRKDGYKIHHTALLVNEHGRPLTKAVLRNHFAHSREAAAKKAETEQKPEFAAEIRAMWFYDLRAKAADDTADDRGEQAASNLLGHESVRTTQRHYLRRGRIVDPTK
jgi:integrase